MSEMIERVALAICGDDNPANVLAIHKTRARAAIEAMREPTDAMSAVGCEIPQWDQETADDGAAAVYRAMIDAALK
jgi:hypothetical protein